MTEEQERPVYRAVDYPIEAYENDTIPMPQSASFGFVKPESIVHSETHGTLIYFPNAKYPSKGLRRGDKIFASDSVKKYIKGWLGVLSGSPTRYFVALVFFLPSFLFKKIIKTWVKHFEEFCYIQARRHWLVNPVYYSVPIREIRRVLLEMFPDSPIIPKTIVFIFEQDLPYLHRFMDIAQQIDKQAIRKNVSREVKRLVEMFAKRDGARDWHKMGWLVWLIVFLRPEVRHLVREFAEKADITKFWFDDCDLYWCLKNDDGGGNGYNYLGFNLEKRTRLHQQLMDDVIQEFKP